MMQPTLGLAAPPRRTPSLLEVASYWYEQPVETFPAYPGHAIGLGEPFCAACGWLVPLPPTLFTWTDDGVPGDPDEAEYRGRWQFATRFLDRAHLVDHCLDGGGAPDNLVPLCKLCHAEQPSFGVGERDAALAWVSERPPKHWAYQMATDEVARRQPEQVQEMRGPQSRTFLRTVYVTTLELIVKLHAEAKAKARADES